MKVRYKFKEGDKYEVLKGNAEKWFNINISGEKDAAEQMVARLQKRGWIAEIIKE